MSQRLSAIIAAALWITASTSAAHADPGAIMGGDLPSGRTLAQVNEALDAMNAAGLGMTRLVLVPDSFYINGKPSLGHTDDIVLACHQHGITPVFLFEYYQFWVPYGYFSGRPITAYDWKGIGKIFAERYVPDSPWLKSHSISGWGVTVYMAINEPDIYLNGGHIPLQDYLDAIQHFAEGIHSAGKSLKVVPGGFARPCSYMDYTAGGYGKILAPLLNDGTLDGVDIHTYNGDYTPMQWDFTAQASFDRVRSACGITRDINYYCTEFNYVSDKHPDPDEWAKNFLSCVWNQLTISNVGGERKVEFAFPFNLNSLKTPKWKFGLSTSLSPWQGDTRGKALQSALSLSRGMEFISCKQGLFELRREGACLWVCQNRKGWRSGPASPSLALDHIPSGMKRLQIWYWDGLSRTIEIAGKTSVTVTDLRTEETVMLLATAK